MKIKRILFYVISVLVCFLLQTSVFNFLKLAGVMPNILLILTVTIAFIRGRKAGIVIGFVCGLLIDIFAMRGRLQFFSYLFKVMIPEAVYTGIVALLIYKILLEVDIKIRDGEKRSMF